MTQLPVAPQCWKFRSPELIVEGENQLSEVVFCFSPSWPDPRHVLTLHRQMIVKNKMRQVSSSSLLIHVWKLSLSQIVQSQHNKPSSCWDSIMFWAILSFVVRSYFKGKIPAYFIDYILIWLHDVSQGYGIRIKTKLKQKKNFHQVVPGQLGLCGLTLS